jgi:hypothetical protein
MAASLVQGRSDILLVMVWGLYMFTSPQNPQVKILPMEFRGA